MNNRFLIIGIVGLMILIMAWWLLTPNAPPPSPQASVQGTGTAANSTSSTTPTSSPGTSLPATPHAPDFPPAPSKEQQMSDALPKLNDVPIVFYGKLIDQYNNPVSGVTVTGSVLISKQWMQQKEEDHTTRTDSDGLFHFEGLHGMSIGICGIMHLTPRP
jgi:hypothetical protein